MISNIENNYVLRFHKVREEQAEMRIQLAEERLQREIQKAKKRFYEEQFATTCTTDTYFNQIEVKLKLLRLHIWYVCIEIYKSFFFLESP